MMLDDSLDWGSAPPPQSATHKQETMSSALTVLSDYDDLRPFAERQLLLTDRSSSSAARSARARSFHHHAAPSVGTKHSPEPDGTTTGRSSYIPQPRQQQHVDPLDAEDPDVDSRTSPVPPPPPQSQSPPLYRHPRRNEEEEEEEQEREDDDGANFMATKPFLGAIYPPSVYIRDPKNPHQVMDETHNNWEAPTAASLELDFVMGYKARDSRYNVHWISETEVMFPVAGVVVIFNMEIKDEDFMLAHNDDVMSLDFHKARGVGSDLVDLAASGALGANTEAELCIWDVKTRKVRHMITGFLQFGVMAVNFNPSATLVCALGFDEHHSVALFSVETGLLMGYSACDKNRVLHCKFNLSESRNDADQSFVTVGLKHICFWWPKETVSKGGNYFLQTDQPLDQRLGWQRGFGIDVIDDIALFGIDFTRAHTIVGGTNGVVYLLDSVKYHMVMRFSISADKPSKIYQILTLRETHGAATYKAKQGPRDNIEVVAIGTHDGVVSFWDVYTDPTLLEARVGENRMMTHDGSQVDLNKIDKATNNPVEFLVNSVRSMCWHSGRGWLAVGTILTSVYSIRVRGWGESAEVCSVACRRLVCGHWGNLKDENGYGETWGVDAHPFEQKVITCGDDSNLRVWDLDTAQEVRRKFVKYPAYKCSYNHDATLIAVGLRNGGFTLLKGDASKTVMKIRRDRKRCVTDICFSPNGKYLAVGAEKAIDVYEIATVTDAVTGFVQATATLIGTCEGHTSYLESFDWNVESTVLQTQSTGYELLYYCIPECVMVTGREALAEMVWYHQTCTLGWSVQGIWPRYADGTDINSVAKSRSQKWLVTTDDWGRVKMFNYPCIGGGLDRRTGKLNIRPAYHEFKGHSSHVTNSCWTFDDTYVVTTGGADLSLFVWKVQYDTSVAPKPKYFLNQENLKQGILRHSRKGVVRTASPTRGEGGASVSEEPMSPLSPREASRGGGRERIANECLMCQYVFDDADMKACPRCMAPRIEKQTAPLRRAWNGALSAQGSARYRLPTASFAQLSKAQQKQRKDVEASRRSEVVWKSGNVKMAEAVHGDSSDEEAINKKLSQIKTLQKRMEVESGPTAKTGPPKKSKKTSGPDFADL